MEVYVEILILSFIKASLLQFLRRKKQVFFTIASTGDETLTLDDAVDVSSHH